MQRIDGLDQHKYGKRHNQKSDDVVDEQAVFEQHRIDDLSGLIDAGLL